jgi:DNA-binding MarR family transcriptional regulator
MSTEKLRAGDIPGVLFICICIYLTMSPSPILTLPCLCGTLRRTSRALTQLYENALRPLGVRSSQFTILQVLSRVGEMSQGALGEILAMDSTTLTRTLAILFRRGWIAQRRGSDRRERLLRLARAGEAQLHRALPLWEETQSRLRSRLGDQAWQDLFQLTNQVTSAVSAREGE